ncbi:MAG: WYL domain-containing transcriptional regulator [Verrucomicrobiota bacterium]
MLSTRPPYLRILRIHERLRDGVGHVGIAELESTLEVSERTVKRDIEYMRDQLGAPIKWGRKPRGYFYSRSFEKLPVMRLSAEEALAVALAKNVFAAWGESALGMALTAALEKVAAVAGDAVSVASDEIEELIISPPGEGRSDAERANLGLLIEAANGRKPVSFDYSKPHRGIERRTVWPLHLARLEGSWILIAHDLAKEAIRKFVLERIDSLRTLDGFFERPENFDAESYLAGSFGRHTGEDAFEVELRFDSFAAPYVKEERWRPERRTVEEEDGGIRVSMTLNNLIDVRRYVLSWGRHAEVLGPMELIAEIEAEAKALWEKHSEKKVSGV